MRLALERCVVRSWEHADVPALARRADDRDVWLQLRDRFPHPFTRADAEAWVQLAQQDRPEVSFAIDIGGEVAGGIGLQLQEDVYRRSAEVGYWIGRDLWGRGLATSALRGFSDWAFARYDVCRLFAYVFASNPASCRVLEKAGYAREACMRACVTKEGRTLDQFLYARIDPARILDVHA